MEIGIPGLRNGKRLRFGKPAVVYLRWLAAGLCLPGIGFLAWFYVSQNNLVAEAFDDLTNNTELSSPLGPLELADLAHKSCVLDPTISNLESFLQPIDASLSSGGWCGNYVRIFVRFAREEGYPAHKFHIQSGGRSHTLAEVYHQGKWRIIDPFFNLAYQLPDGEMATFQDLKDNPGLLERPVQRPLDNPDLERSYGKYFPRFPALYRDAPDFYLRLTPSAFYHNGFVLLSFPLAIFYEGGRRPILPSWMDRPELLGIYGLSLVFLVLVVPPGFTWVKSKYRNYIG